MLLAPEHQQFGVGGEDFPEGILKLAAGLNQPLDFLGPSGGDSFDRKRQSNPSVHAVKLVVKWGSERRADGKGAAAGLTGTAAGFAGLIAFRLLLGITESANWPAAMRIVAREPAAAAYGAVLRNPQFWRVLAVTILLNPCLYFQVNWLPTYFVQQRGLAAGRELGLILTLIYIGLDIGYLTCGVAVRLLMGRGLSVSAARRVVFSAATVLLAMWAVGRDRERT
ncbi:MAG: hypothetical protein AAB225_14840 [Acidobacteriota bacterium]